MNQNHTPAPTLRSGLPTPSTIQPLTNLVVATVAVVASNEIVVAICRDDQAAKLIASIPDMLATATELDRLCLVIESAVGIADPAHHAAVVALLKTNRAALAKAKLPAEAIKPV